MNKLNRYLIVVLAFVVVTLAASIVRPDTGVHVLYLIALFCLCSTPLLDITRLNDRYALLSVFSIVYFVMYGLLDLTTLLFADSRTIGSPLTTSGGPLSSPELLILVGNLLVQVSYRSVCLIVRPGKSSGGDWPETTLIVIGTSLWAICTWLFWRFKVNVVVDETVEGINGGLTHLSGLQTTIYMLASYLQPLGIVILAYAQCIYRRPYMILLLAAAIAVEMVFGFVSDMKGQVFIGLILVALTKLMVNGSIPKARLLLIAALITVVFPILQANRAVRGEYDVNHTQAAQNLLKTFQRALEKKQDVTSGTDRAQTFFERTSLKSSVELIVSKTGRDVPFQNGYTLSPILTVFIPRLLWPTKPDVQTGRIMNKEFNVTEQEETYISPSHLGELYWNFGWAGVMLGMPLIGAMFGLVGINCDLSRSITLTHVLILIATIKLLVLGFESSIAPQYSTWLRMMAAIGLLRLVFARARSTTLSSLADQSIPATTPNLPSRLLPNLMR